MSSTKRLWSGLALLLVASFSRLLWMRVPGDTVSSAGALLLAWFVCRLWIAPRLIAQVAGEALGNG